MEPFVLYLEKTNEGEEIFNSYRKMREALQDFNIAEWQLEKGYRIPGTIYLLRTETLREKNRVEKLLKRYGLLNKFGDEEKFNEYVVKKFYEIDQETPLQKGKPDYLDDEDN